MLKDWVNAVYVTNVVGLCKQFSANRPFPHLLLGSFFSERVRNVADSLLRERFVEQNSDLFQFEQTDDLSKTKSVVLQEFFSFCNSKEFLRFIGEVTGSKLTHIDMSGFIYDDADYLLPHDDRLEGRKIAYILNLSENFTPADGGALQFFVGKDVVKSVPPSFNTLTLFKVSSSSVHQVQEVFSDKKRLSLAGWFYG
ncbi:2OG-Fe(II) oxygenase [Candidatus Woesearchaeota archaeon]|nr:2OG-Fe(II) oxygenase [Candidatus Woesearchaeota archaeon]